jgi:hypothetical protein
MASTTAAATDGSIFPARRWHERYHAQSWNWTAPNFRAGLLKLAGRFSIGRKKS